MRASEFIPERKKKKSSRSTGGYFFPGYAYYGSGESGEGGGDGGGESVNRGVAEGSPNADVKKQISKFEELALAANREGDDAKCKQYQQKIQSLKQKMSQGMAEGSEMLSLDDKIKIYSKHKSQAQQAENCGDYTTADKHKKQASRIYSNIVNLHFGDDGKDAQNSANDYIRKSQGVAEGQEKNHWYDAGVKDATRGASPNPRTYLPTLKDKQAKHPEEVDFYMNGYKSVNQDVAENFADGRNPQDKGDSQRHGIPKGATMAQLEKAAKAPGRKGQLARWQLNMRRGQKK